MTTVAVRRNNPLPLIILGILLLAVLYILTASQHAVKTHVWDADKVIQCLNDNGPYMRMVYKSKDGKFYLPCQLPDGRIGLGIFTAKGENFTAYIPKDGAWSAVRSYIEQRATRFTGGLPF